MLRDGLALVSCSRKKFETDYRRGEEETVKEIVLNHGKVALVDDEDFERVTKLGRWGAMRDPWNWYAARYVNVNNKTVTTYMHRFIMDAPKGMQVDHINGDGLDNRRSNLRLATSSQNGWNRRARRPRKRAYKGITPKGGKWLAKIVANGKTYHLGYFSSPALGAAMYDLAALALHGEFALLNFPELKGASSNGN